MNFTNTDCVENDWGGDKLVSQVVVSDQAWDQVFDQVFDQIYRIINKIHQEINK
jgi:hypothetical protein